MTNILYLDATRGLYGASRALLTLLENVERREVRPYVVLANDLEDDTRFSTELDRLHLNYREYKLAVLRRQKYLNPRGLLFIGSSLLRSVLFLRKVIRRYKIDLVQTNTSTVLSGAVAAALTGVPHIWHVHEMFRRAEGKILGRMLYLLSTCVVANSQATRRNLITSYPPLKSKLMVITNGVDPTPFRNVSMNDIRSLRQEWSLAATDRVVGMIGRIGMWKGEEQFVEMAQMVSRQCSDVKFVIVGGTFEGRRHHLIRLQSLIDKKGLTAQVILAGLREDIPVVLNIFDVLVHLPIRLEPFGLVAIEAMSAGKPVVAAALGGLVEIVLEGETGYLVQPGQVETAAEKVCGLLGDEPLRLCMGQAGSVRVDAEFSSAAYATRFQSLYNKIQAGSP